MMDLFRRDIVDLSGLLNRNEVSAVDLADSCLTRISDRQEVNAFVNVFPSTLMRATASTADQDRAAGNGGPLCGIPLAVKDNICLRNEVTSCGSGMLGEFVPPYDATAVAGLKTAGAVIIGKTNLDEFGMGSSNENSFYGPVVNPCDRTRVAGGSSGGSAAAVADFQVPAALGSDTGGSVRQPAAFCGVVGLKPTYGAISRFGLVAFASSLDQIGVITRTVADCVLVYEVISGHDQNDATSVPVTFNPDCLSGPGPRLKIGVPGEYFGDGLNPQVGRVVEQTVARLAAVGHEVKNISLPHTCYAVATYYIIADAEASANLARYDAVGFSRRAPEFAELREMYCRSRVQGFGDEVKRRLILGTYILSAGYRDKYYHRAGQVRRLIAADFEDAFAEVELIVTPTTPTTAFKLGEKSADPLALYLADVYTTPASLAGLPAVSVPCGQVDGLPVGLQIIGPRFAEEKLLNLAAEVERLSLG